MSVQEIFVYFPLISKHPIIKTLFLDEIDGTAWGHSLTFSSGKVATT